MASAKLPSTAACIKHNTEYLEKVREYVQTHPHGKTSRAQAVKDFRVLKAKGFDTLKPEDFLAVVADEALLAEWQEAHLEMVEATLASLKEELELSEATKERLTTMKEGYLSEVYELDQSVPPAVPQEEFDAIVRYLRTLVVRYPGASSEVLKDVSQIQAAWEQKCN